MKSCAKHSPVQQTPTGCVTWKYLEFLCCVFSSQAISFVCSYCYCASSDFATESTFLLEWHYEDLANVTHAKQSQREPQNMGDTGSVLGYCHHKAMWAWHCILSFQFMYFHLWLFCVNSPGLFSSKTMKKGSILLKKGTGIFGQYVMV